MFFVVTYVTMNLYFYKNCMVYDFSMYFMAGMVEDTDAIDIKLRRKVMKQIQDDALLQFYMEKYGIAELFETEGLTFRLYEYERGEILNFIRDSSQCLQFFVKGNAVIYSVRTDGSRYPLCNLDSFTMLGDMELCGEQSSLFLVEALTNVLCVELSLYECRASLLNDRVFLRYLARSVAKKLAMVLQTDAVYATLEERFLHYIKQECPHGTLHGVEAAAVSLHCSRRQLQRILKKLTEEGIIKKCDKGIYRIIT